ncbi:hypothetical protein PR048_005089 [Dryococelus australis]|uniref:DUF8207 domain-containing protein n=1 Tax=Dryococelus australis TaxID=614101 RepID=A0ABQ9I9B5_9NEOP|nr:hypothetical protein PR048_005089 [Dryococelus australis]
MKNLHHLRGLYELLFKHHPGHQYSENALQQHKHLLETTNAHYQGNDSSVGTYKKRHAKLGIIRQFHLLVASQRAGNRAHNNEILNILEELREEVITYGKDEMWKVHLLIMSSNGHANHGYNYILTVMYVYSKYSWVRYVKSKTGCDVSSAMENTLHEGRVPKHLHTD